MSQKKMPQDANGVSIQVLNPVNGSDYELSVTATSARTAQITQKVVGIYSDNGAYIKFGDNTIDSADDDYDAFLPPASYREYSMGGDQYIAVISDGTDGTLYINGLE